MSASEVLQSCTTQRKALLSAIGGVDPSYTSLISFDSDNCEPHLSPFGDFDVNHWLSWQDLFSNHSR